MNQHRTGGHGARPPAPAGTPQPFSGPPHAPSAHRTPVHDNPAGPPQQPRQGFGVVTRDVVLILLGIMLGMAAVVFPWTAWQIRKARRAGVATGVRWVLGAIASAGVVVLGVAFFAWAGWDVFTWALDQYDRATGGFLLTIAGLGGLSLLTGLVILATARRRPAGAPRPGSMRPVAGAAGAAPIDRKLFDDSEHSRRVESALRTLSSHVALYAGYHMGGRPVGDRISAVVGEVHELIRRLDSRGTAQQVRLAKAQYADTLEKLVAFTGPEYLKDVIDNPRLWHHPDQRVAEVGAALDAVSQQVVENIRQVNSSQDLNFQVALKQLQAITEDDEFAALYAGKGAAR